MAQASPLMPMEDSLRDARRLPYWTQSEREALATKIEAVLRDWQRAYLSSGAGDDPDDGLGRIHCEPLSAACSDDGSVGCAEAIWTPLGSEAGLPGHPARAWWSLGVAEDHPDRSQAESRFVRDLKSLIFGMDPGKGTSGNPMSLDETLAQEAWEALCGGMRAALGLQAPAATMPTTLPVELRRGWSGALLISWSLYGHAMRLAVLPDPSQLPGRRSEDRINGPRPNRPALVPLLEAAQGLRIRLHVDLGSMDLPLGALMALQVGDVIRTSHPLEQSLLVRGPSVPEDSARSSGSGAAVLAGFLGKQDDCFAITLTPRR